MTFQVNFIDDYLNKPIISKYLQTCPIHLENKIIRQLQHLKEFGLTQANPNLKKITGTSLWEIRILGRQNLRLICVAKSHQEIVILHIFSKKTQKTSPKDLNLAQKRQKLILD